MVCPMQDRRTAPEGPSEYPFEPIYRPWSWLVSSFSNVILLAVVVGLAYYLCRRRRARAPTTSFRYVGDSSKLFEAVVYGNC